MNNKKTKRVTIADLAKMIKEDVVDHMATKEDLKNLEEKIDTKIEGLKDQIAGVGKRINDFVETRVKYEDHNKLKARVDFIEKKLEIK